MGGLFEVEGACLRPGGTGTQCSRSGPYSTTTRGCTRTAHPAGHRCCMEGGLPPAAWKLKGALGELGGEPGGAEPAPYSLGAIVCEWPHLPNADKASLCRQDPQRGPQGRRTHAQHARARWGSGLCEPTDWTRMVWRPNAYPFYGLIPFRLRLARNCSVCLRA